MADLSSTVWDSFSGKPVCVNDVSEFLTELDDNTRHSNKVQPALGQTGFLLPSEFLHEYRNQ